MGRLFLMHLDGNAYSCKFCRTHLGLAADIISKVHLTSPLESPVSLLLLGRHAGCDSEFHIPFLAVLPLQARQGVPLQPGVSGHFSSPRFARLPGWILARVRRSGL
jgi:hypothetical protein